MYKVLSRLSLFPLFILLFSYVARAEEDDSNARVDFNRYPIDLLAFIRIIPKRWFGTTLTYHSSVELLFKLPESPNVAIELKDSFGLLLKWNYFATADLN